jgi:2-keto-3-deoxy-L-rhamnonate aldolase RhmA
MVAFGSGDLAYSVGEGTQMLTGPKVQEAYMKVLASAKRHDVAVIGGPVLQPTEAGCRQALEDGVTVFSLGLDSLGFRSYCEQTVAALNDSLSGSEWDRPSAPASGFPAA